MLCARMSLRNYVTGDMSDKKVNSYLIRAEIEQVVHAESSAEAITKIKSALESVELTQNYIEIVDFGLGYHPSKQEIKIA